MTAGCRPGGTGVRAGQRMFSFWSHRPGLPAPPRPPVLGRGGRQGRPSGAAVRAGGPDGAIGAHRPAARAVAGDAIEVRLLVRDRLRGLEGAGRASARSQSPAGAGHPDRGFVGDECVGDLAAERGPLAQRAPGLAAVRAPAQRTAGSAGEHEPTPRRGRQRSARPRHRETGRRPAPSVVAAAQEAAWPERESAPGREQAHGPQGDRRAAAGLPPGPSAVALVTIRPPSPRTSACRSPSMLTEYRSRSSPSAVDASSGRRRG